MRAESFSHIASGLQNIAVIIGLAIGGWWTANTFIFQNPAYYESGGEASGYEPEMVQPALALSVLEGSAARLVEVTLTVTNKSKTHAHIIIPKNTEVVYFKEGEVKGRAQFRSSLAPDASVRVPVGESRDFPFLAQFPEVGTYVVEADLCKRYGSSCLVQKYIHVP